MAKKKGGFGRFLGALTGSPYEQLLKQIEKLTDSTEDDAELGRKLKKLSKVVQQRYTEEAIDDEEHDLLMEEIEEVDPRGRSFPKLDDDSGDIYDGEVPDAPDPELGKKVDLDDLMRSKEGSFTGTFGRDEFDEFRNKMTEDFYAESDEAVTAGDHAHEIVSDHRVFGGAEEDLDKVKRQLAEESGLVDPNARPEGEDDDETYRVDDDGTEWWQDDDGYWWFREPGQDDWQPFEE